MDTNQKDNKCYCSNTSNSKLLLILVIIGIGTGVAGVHTRKIGRS
jgi:hypothetical protein